MQEERIQLYVLFIKPNQPRLFLMKTLRNACLFIGDTFKSFRKAVEALDDATESLVCDLRGDPDPDESFFCAAPLFLCTLLSLLVSSVLLSIIISLITYPTLGWVVPIISRLFENAWYMVFHYLALPFYLSILLLMFLFFRHAKSHLQN